MHVLQPEFVGHDVGRLVNIVHVFFCHERHGRQPCGYGRSDADHAGDDRSHELYAESERNHSAVRWHYLYDAFQYVAR
jgi:hypothetical protein